MPIINQAELGQGLRGAAGYADAGESELIVCRTDPVCGAQVNPEHAETSEYKDDRYYFDSADCKQRFDKAPERYTRTPDTRTP